MAIGLNFFIESLKNFLNFSEIFSDLCGYVYSSLVGFFFALGAVGFLAAFVFFSAPSVFLLVVLAVVFTALGLFSLGRVSLGLDSTVSVMVTVSTSICTSDTGGGVFGRNNGFFRFILHNVLNHCAF